MGSDRPPSSPAAGTGFRPAGAGIPPYTGPSLPMLTIICLLQQRLRPERSIQLDEYLQNTKVFELDEKECFNQLVDIAGAHQFQMALVRARNMMSSYFHAPKNAIKDTLQAMPSSMATDTLQAMSSCVMADTYKPKFSHVKTDTPKAKSCRVKTDTPKAKSRQANTDTPNQKSSLVKTDTPQPMSSLVKTETPQPMSSCVKTDTPQAKSFSGKADTPQTNSSSVKRPSDDACSSSPISKKQKVGEAPQDATIKDFDDVFTVTGINLQGEEENLFSASKEESDASDATRKIAHIGKKWLILQEQPLRKKIFAITNDVEHCLSLTVEKHLLMLINSMIRHSKIRVGTEKLRHCNSIQLKSDIKHQIMMINREAKEVADKKRADEAEKQRRLDEIEEDREVKAAKHRRDGPLKSLKKDVMEEAQAANIAARAATGGDDMVLKWQMMAARLNQDGERLRPLKENQEPESRGLSTDGIDGIGGSYSEEIKRTVSLRDAVSVMEIDPHLMNSILLYRAYEKLPFINYN